MSTLYRATVTRVDSEGVFVEVPELGGGGEWGPLELLAIPLSEGDSVLVGSINETMEDLALLGKLVLEVPDEVVIPPTYTPPANSSFVLYYENESARIGAGLTPTSGLTTWLDDEQRLEIYTDEGTPGWVTLYGSKASKLLYPPALQIGIGVTSPTASLSIATVTATDRVIDAKVATDTTQRLRVNASGLFEWGDGTTLDTDLQRSASGTAGLLITPRIGVGGAVASTATVTARQSTNRVGFFSNNTEAAVTHPLAHFYAIEAGNDDSGFLGSYKSGEANARFLQKVDGKQTWGPGGGTSPDTNLYRAGVAQLKTDSYFYTDGGLGITQGKPRSKWVVKKILDQALTLNSTTMQDVTDMFFTVVNGGEYWISVRLSIGSAQVSTVGDVRIAWTTPTVSADRFILAGATSMVTNNEASMVINVRGMGTTQGGGITATGTAGSGSTYNQFTGWWEDIHLVAEADGTIQLQAAQNTSSGATSQTIIRGGSRILVERLA